MKINSFLQRNLVIFFLILFGCIISSLLFYLFVPISLTQQTSDYVSFYKPVANNIIEGNGLKDSKGQAATRYPPGYPILLSLIFIFNNYVTLPESYLFYCTNILFLTIATFTIFLIIKQVTGPSYALIPVFGIITYPFIIWLVFQQTAELPFMVFLYTALLLFTSAVLKKSGPAPLFIAGFLFGAAMLIKPIAVGIPFILVPAYLYTRKELPCPNRLIHTSLLIFGALLPVIPWELWVYAKTGRILLLSSGGLPSMLDGLTYGIADKGYRAGIWLPADVKELMFHFQVLRPKLTSLISIYSELLNMFIAEPIAFLKFIGLKAIRVWFGTDSQRYENFIALIQFPYFISFLLTSFFIHRQSNDYKILLAIILVSVFYFWFMSLLVLQILRYMVPAIGLLFMLWPMIVICKK